MNYDEESKDIYVSDQELDGLFSAWNSQTGRPPNEQEVISIINDFIEEEILYREALRLGLDKTWQRPCGVLLSTMFGPKLSRIVSISIFYFSEPRGRGGP